MPRLPGQVRRVRRGLVKTYIQQIYEELSKKLHLKLPLTKVKQGERSYIKLIDNEADELWSFLGRRKGGYYVWVVMHRESRQFIAFQVGDRSRQTARQLWEKIPEYIRRYGLLHTAATACHILTTEKATRPLSRRASTCTPSKKAHQPPGAL